MLYEGKAITCQKDADGIVELKFDLQGESVNKFNKVTLTELDEAIEAIKTDSAVKGVVITSGKDSFIVGADITEFVGYFSLPEEELLEWVGNANATFNKFEDLEVPSVCAINGIAFGGGCEITLAADFRVMSTTAKIGLPEVKLGIFPGFGGTVRLSRIIGADNAIEWIAAGSDQRADAAFKVGAVDALVAPEKVREGAYDLVKRAISGELDWKAKKQEKLDPLPLKSYESLMVFEGAKGFIAAKAGPHYKAPVKAVIAMQNGADKGRDDALKEEAKQFVKVARTAVTNSLVNLFLSDQYLKKEAKKYKSQAKEVKKGAIIGAGIMGGGIAYQSAYKKIPVYMKDINDAALQLGLGEATSILEKRVNKKRMTPGQMAGVLNTITATLSYNDLKDADIVVEAVVENVNVKRSVLQELEGVVADDAILTSNTSTILISDIAEGLKRPENFCGMHFFNPVPKMPLVEVIRGEKSSEKAIATTVAYATAMGKTAIVVNDCPGFLVNRILFPYFAGFMKLVEAGADYKQIDKVMEKFGWPMGPAYLLDVVGMDTAHHAGDVMAAGYPDRMKNESKTALDVMYAEGRFGQKTDLGFYSYALDRKGRVKKSVDPKTEELLKAVQPNGTKEFTDEEIIDRMMIPMVVESVRCLEDKIVETPNEVDMGLIFGLGFPPFRGGALKYADSLGLTEFCEKADKYAEIGKVYQVTEGMREMAKAGKTFYAN
ncbi:MAG: 3-hydroxyacyl-CoA dehydrogenase/enoyl-CoA hydratase/3-hydroxybutyryl-CoA epimerase [bacterium]|jgi:3-hydroxyacyl-CoA dehydrogenase/enoyl-CoA hydratase/3-hydroxybutyryl-CoA epimerase/enoyl-CoA isomerase